MLKLYFCNIPNFGDQLNPEILKKFGIPFQITSPYEADVAGVGSILEHFHANLTQEILMEPVLTLSSGLGFTYKMNPHQDGALSKDETFFRPILPLSVRGRLTANRIEVTSGFSISDERLGDAGLLVSTLYKQRRVKKTHRLGIALHYASQQDRKAKQILSLFPDALLIDITQSPRHVSQEILRCETILSNALHPLIAADSLGVPNKWIRFSEKYTSYFKFQDYYSIYNQSPKPWALADLKGFRKIEDAVIESYLISEDQIQQKVSEIENVVIEFKKISKRFTWRARNEPAPDLTIIEANPYHSEVVRAYAEQTIRAGKSVEIITRRNNLMTGLHWLESLHDVPIYYLKATEMIRLLKDTSQLQAKSLLFSTSVLWDAPLATDSLMSLFDRPPLAEKGVLFHDHNTDVFHEHGLNVYALQQRVFVSFPFQQNEKLEVSHLPIWSATTPKPHLEKGNLRILIIGRLSQEVKDISFLQSKINRVPKNVIFVVVATSFPAWMADHPQIELHRFLSAKTLDSLLLKIDYLLPLIHVNTPSGSRYTKHTSTGSIVLALSSGVPILTTKAVALTYNLSKNASVIYTEGNFIASLKKLSALPMNIRLRKRNLSIKNSRKLFTHWSDRLVMRFSPPKPTRSMVEQLTLDSVQQVINARKAGTAVYSFSTQSINQDLQHLEAIRSSKFYRLWRLYRHCFEHTQKWLSYPRS